MTQSIDNEKTSPRLAPVSANADSLDYWLFLLFHALFILLGGAAIALTYRLYPLPGETDGFFIGANWLRCGYTRQFLDTFLHDWGPLYPAAIAWAARLTASTHMAGKILNVWAGAGIVGLTYLLGAVHFQARRVSVFAALLVAVNPLFVYYSTVVCSDIPAVFLVLLAIHHSLYLFRAEAHWRNGIFAGVFFALACLVRYQSYFPFFGMLLALLLLCGNWQRRLAATSLMLLGFIVPMTISVAFGIHQFGDFGGWIFFTEKGLEVWRPAVASHEFQQTLAGFLAGYFRGLKLLLWAIAFLPAVGLWLILFNFPKRAFGSWRQILAMALPLAVYFIGVGWFPQAGHTEVRRLFLLYAPFAALFFAAAVERFPLNNSRSTWPRGIVWLLVLIVAGWIAVTEYPCLCPKHENPLHRWLGLEEVWGHCEKPSAENKALDAAREFIALEQPGCKQIMTNSAAATTLFTNSIYFGYGKSVANEKMQSILYERSLIPTYVMFSNQLGENNLRADEPFGPDGRFTLEYLYSLRGSDFYRLHDRRLPAH